MPAKLLGSLLKHVSSNKLPLRDYVMGLDTLNPDDPNGGLTRQTFGMRHLPPEEICACQTRSPRSHRLYWCARRPFRDGTMREVRGLAARNSLQVPPGKRKLGMFLCRMPHCSSSAFA